MRICCQTTEIGFLDVIVTEDRENSQILCYTVFENVMY